MSGLDLDIYKMLLKFLLFVFTLWNICMNPVFGQNYPVRNGRYLINTSISTRFRNNIYSNPASYNGHSDEKSGNVIVHSNKPMSHSRQIARRNNTTFNYGTWKVLNENKDIQPEQRAKIASERKCNPSSGDRGSRCLRRINRRKVQNGGYNSNNKMIRGLKESLPNNSRIYSINIDKSVNDEKPSAVLQTRDGNKLSAKGSNPCSCYWQQEQCGCDCEGTLTYDDFQDVSRSFFTCQNFTFTMADGEFYALPPNFFSKIKNVQDFNLFITNSTFEYMCDPTPLTSPFKGVIFENSAQIKLMNVNVRRGWNWTPFEQLKSASGALVNISLENCQLRRLTSDFANLAGGHVDTIDIYSSDMEMVGSNAFVTFENMTRFRIPSNKIRHLRRTDFPELLLNLEELDLRNNELNYLDNDLFTNMPSLKEIFLSGNPINVLPEATFQAVISKAELVGISDISLTCDCRLQWLKDLVKNDSTTARNMKGAICRRPSYLRGMPFKFLSKEHLICS